MERKVRRNGSVRGKEVEEDGRRKKKDEKDNGR